MRKDTPFPYQQNRTNSKLKILLINIYIIINNIIFKIFINI